VTGTFRLITYQAYNALGLIGPEHNGIAIFDLDRYKVVCDRVLEQDTGYYGASAKQVSFFNRLVEMSWSTFREFVNSHPQHRYEL
jgi:hypothetical protein